MSLMNEPQIQDEIKNYKNNTKARDVIINCLTDTILSRDTRSKERKEI